MTILLMWLEVKLNWKVLLRKQLMELIQQETWMPSIYIIHHKYFLVTDVDSIISVHHWQFCSPLTTLPHDELLCSLFNYSIFLFPRVTRPCANKKISLHRDHQCANSTRELTIITKYIEHLDNKQCEVVDQQ